ncbi:hypothetical protein E2986_06159 [Frieseomelitta varia]|uniref:Tropomyosin n=1 Tax=Frieseomelitta varia TaxID=561572 RepID=A0A833W628_9HYME|nr:tropomyosin-1 [Frieseomelitta varia]XP_043516523.1 tropomyosin-1 [Frieseomelitta varia]KAF3424887.1 hypothetical protein E2986_06159 [Frieseomelitta varia]
MSDNESFESATEPNSNLPKITKSDEQNNMKHTPETEIENPITITESKNELQELEDIECKVSHCTEDEVAEMPTREIDAAIIENARIICEAVNESIEKKVEDSTTKQNELPPNVPVIQQEISIGAGDTCLVTRQDRSADAQKPEEQIAITGIIDQVKLESDKPVIENDKNVTETELMISKLKEEVQKTINERDSYQKKLGNVEKKLAELQAAYDSLMKGEGNEVMLRRMVDQLKGKLIQTSLQLEDRIRTVSNQEKQISALNSQVASLKEVESLTRSLLQIRNMEVKHLQAEVDDMEVRISEERERYNTMINKMDAAVKLNADLKKEYETQLCLFRDLREKYEEKVSLLSEEKRALEANTPSPK